jgi:glutaredoxin
MKRITANALLAALAAVAFAAPAAAQYRWTDPQGNVNYGDRPPADARDVRAVGGRGVPGPAGAEAATNLPYELRRAMERAPVVLYTSPECQPCAPATALLRSRGVPFAERTVITNEDLQEFRRISGGLRLPHVTIGSQSQNGFNADVWTALLDAAGYPKGSMLPRSYAWPAAQPLAAAARPEVKAEARAAEPAPAAEPAKR